MTEDKQTNMRSDRRIFLRAGIGLLFSSIVWGALLFGSAGTLAWLRGWIHLCVWLFTLTFNFLVLAWKNPAVLKSRLSRKRSDERFDRILVALIFLASLLMPAIAGIDAVRFGWSAMGYWGIGFGILLHFCGDVIVLWTMLVNPFLEKSVCIQTERSHHVIANGPYSRVRHPMYTGSILLMMGLPLMLGSWWAFAPVGAYTIILLVRTVYEDRFLLRKLAGYAEFAQQTRYRLIPKIW